MIYYLRYAQGFFFFFIGNHPLNKAGYMAIKWLIKNLKITDMVKENPTLDIQSFGFQFII